ncbi:MAG: hypothetical protein JST17_14895 [Bacteroidetes bacterium]|nr:hypothetical protein [Bacteroidota bacterium]
MDYWKKYLIKKIIRLTPQFHYYRRRITHQQKINDNILKNIIKHVPYYKKMGYEPGKMECYPLIRKSDIVGKEEQFISNKIRKHLLIKKTTGGTSGNYLTFYKTINAVIREEAFISYVFSLIGTNLRIAVLRGNRPSSGIYEYKFQHLLLSSYHLTKETVLEYLKLMNKYKINCMHVYPSAIHIFCKYLREILKEGNVELPKIKGIFSSSEILTAEVKDEIMELFPDTILIDQYGQTELVAFAISINKGYYRFYNVFSFVELIDTGIKNGKNRVKEIVGTNVNNKGMPLIRYRTGDFVEVDENENIIGIIGRTNDFVVNSKKEIQPCNVVMRGHTLKHVISSQYYQDTIGELIYRVKVNDKFGETDVKNIQEDLNEIFQGLMTIKVQVVQDFEKTLNGKHVRAIQRLSLS